MLRTLGGLVLVLALGADAGTARADWLRRGVNDGLAGALVHGIAEAPDGAMWFATDNGASRFDGVDWTTVRDSLVPPSQRPGSPALSAVTADSEGGMWFATEQHGLAHFDGRAWSWMVAGTSALPSDNVRALLCDRSGDLWVGTQNGVARRVRSSGAWVQYGAGPGALVGGVVTALVEDAQHAIWVGSPGGASRLDSLRTGPWTTFTSPLVTQVGSDSVLSLAATRDGAVWFGTERGIVRDSADTWSHESVADGAVSDSIIAMLGSTRGDLWIGGRAAGIGRFDGRTWSAVRATPDGTVLNGVSALYEDSRHAMWVGTLTGGVLRSDGVEWSALVGPCTAGSGGCHPVPPVPSQVALPSDDVADILQDKEGEVWVATRDADAAVRSTRGDWSPVSTGFSAELRCLLQDRSGAMWFGSYDGGVVQRIPKPLTWYTYGPNEGLPSDSVSTLFEDAQGTLWAGGHGGVARFDGASWTPFFLGPQDGEGVIAQIVQDADGFLWARGDRGALYRSTADRSSFAAVGVADGLVGGIAQAMTVDGAGTLVLADSSRLLQSSGGALVPMGIDLPPALAQGFGSALSLHGTRAGDLWVVGAVGALRVRPGKVTTFFPESPDDPGAGPANHSNGGFLEDESGTVWISTATGVSRFNGQRWRSYGQADGIPVEPSVLRTDRRGNLWLGGGFGITVHALDHTAPWTTLVPRPDTAVAQRTIDYRMGAFADEADLTYRVYRDGMLIGESADPHLSIADWSEGPHTYAATAVDWVGNVDPRPVRGAFTLDSTAPTPALRAPAFGAAVSGVVAVLGEANDARLASWSLVARASSACPYDTTLARGTTVAPGDTLARWNTVGLCDGLYTLTLTESDNLGLVGSTNVTVQVDNVAPFANVSSPRTIGNAVGGDAYSIPGDAHFYFPPHAFASGTNQAVVVLAPADTAGSGLPPGTAKLDTLYDVDWQPELLAHDAVVDFAAPAAAAGADVPALWRWRAADGWQRLGGVRDGGRVTSATRLPGRFALLAGGAVPAHPGGVLALSIAPRVFSPAGVAQPVAPGPSGGGVAIAFELARAAPATIGVYDRAGHLVRRLADATMFAAGTNVVPWDGRDREGHTAPDGPYIVRVEALGGGMQKTVAVVR